jgi:hypothetical protein
MLLCCLLTTTTTECNHCLETRPLSKAKRNFPTKNKNPSDNNYKKEWIFAITCHSLDVATLAHIIRMTQKQLLSLWLLQQICWTSRWGFIKLFRKFVRFFVTWALKSWDYLGFKYFLKQISFRSDVNYCKNNQIPIFLRITTL